jgi:hypothetical protein
MKSRAASKVSQNIPCALYGSSARGDCAKTAQSAAVNASPFQSIGLLLHVALGEPVGAGRAAETFVAVAPPRFVVFANSARATENKVGLHSFLPFVKFIALAAEPITEDD